MLARLRQFAGRHLPPAARERIAKRKVYFGLLTWQTKSYEIWLVLQHLLFLTRPSKLVELGCGRSTDYLAEYAGKFNADMISIEESFVYTTKINLALRFLFLRSRVVKHIPVRGGWYDKRSLERVLKDFGSFDFIFVDGPSEFVSGKRDQQLLYNFLSANARNIKLAVVDDVQRSHCDELAQAMVTGLNLARFDIEYFKDVRHRLAFLIGRELEHVIDELPAYLAELLISRDDPESDGRSSAESATVGLPPGRAQGGRREAGHPSRLRK